MFLITSLFSLHSQLFVNVVGAIAGVALIVVAVIVAFKRRSAPSRQPDIESGLSKTSTTEYFANPAYKGQLSARNTTEFLKSSAEMEAQNTTGDVHFNGREFVNEETTEYYIEE
jgi:hypothetical protein